MLATQNSSSPRLRTTYWWMRVSSARQLSIVACTPVISSSCDSLKSVVMCGCVSAAPSAAGCGVSASVPSGCARRPSRSMPRRMPARRSAGQREMRSRNSCGLGVIGRARRTGGRSKRRPTGRGSPIVVRRRGACAVGPSAGASGRPLLPLSPFERWRAPRSPRRPHRTRSDRGDLSFGLASVESDRSPNQRQCSAHRRSLHRSAFFHGRRAEVERAKAGGHPPTPCPGTEPRALARHGQSTGLSVSGLSPPGRAARDPPPLLPWEGARRPRPATALVFDGRRQTPLPDEASGCPYP
jgi:hypothetical protein